MNNAAFPSRSQPQINKFEKIEKHTHAQQHSRREQEIEKKSAFGQRVPQTELRPPNQLACL